MNSANLVPLSLLGLLLMSQPVSAQEDQTEAPPSPNVVDPTEQGPSAPEPAASPMAPEVPQPLPRAVEASEPYPAASADESDAAYGRKKGFAMEFSTAGFASSELLGGVFLGAQGKQGSLGVGIDYQRSSLSDGVFSVANARTSFLLGGRLRLAEAAKGRVECLLGMEFGFANAWTSTEGPDSEDGGSESATGLVASAGPSLRVWIFDGLAVGYQTRLRFSTIAGPGPLVSMDEEASESDELEATNLGFDGRFTLFGVF